eukprot:COSAG06_NODE_24038_length_674_cov_1.902609_1_plen_64_part_01
MPASQWTVAAMDLCGCEHLGDAVAAQFRRLAALFSSPASCIRVVSVFFFSMNDAYHVRVACTPA